MEDEEDDDVSSRWSRGPESSSEKAAGGTSFTTAYKQDREQGRGVMAGRRAGRGAGGGCLACVRVAVSSRESRGRGEEDRQACRAWARHDTHDSDDDSSSVQL